MVRNASEKSVALPPFPMEAVPSPRGSEAVLERNPMMGWETAAMNPNFGHDREPPENGKQRYHAGGTARNDPDKV